MKKMIVMALGLLLSASLHAQQETGTLTIQPKVGLNMASVTKSDGSDPRFGLAAGAELEYQLSDMISLSGGALYSMQGVKGEDSGINGTIKFDYINIPLLVNIYATKGLAVKFGLQPGFMINDKVKVSTGGVSAEVGVEEALRNAGINAKLNKFDLSIPVGLSYQFSNNLVLDARWNVGLTKIIKDQDGSNSVLQLTVGYKFAL